MILMFLYKNMAEPPVVVHSGSASTCAVQTLLSIPGETLELRGLTVPRKVSHALKVKAVKNETFTVPVVLEDRCAIYHCSTRYQIDVVLCTPTHTVSKKCTYSI